MYACNLYNIILVVILSFSGIIKVHLVYVNLSSMMVSSHSGENRGRLMIVISGCS
jgi:hypothetical protein